MAKKKASSKPQPNSAPSPRIERNGIGTGTICVPLAQAKLVGYEKDQVEEGKIRLENSSAQYIGLRVGPEIAQKFQLIKNGLVAQGSALQCGRPVFSNADVLRWMMENIQIETDWCSGRG